MLAEHGASDGLVLEEDQSIAGWGYQVNIAGDADHFKPFLKGVITKGSSTLRERIVAFAVAAAPELLTQQLAVETLAPARHPR